VAADPRRSRQRRTGGDGPGTGPAGTGFGDAHEHPGVAGGNWSWRAPEGSWTPEMAARLAQIVEGTDRDNDPLGKAKEDVVA